MCTDPLPLPLSIGADDWYVAPEPLGIDEIFACCWVGWLRKAEGVGVMGFGEANRAFENRGWAGVAKSSRIPKPLD